MRRAWVLVTALALLDMPSTGPASAGPAEPARTSASLQGRVLDAQGAPVAGASVEARLAPPRAPFEGWETSTRHLWSALERARAARVDPWTPLARATTDAAGRWRLAGLDPERRVLLGARAGAERGAPPRVVRPTDPWSATDLRLEPAGAALLRVVDAADHPVAGALVLLSTAEHAYGDATIPVARATTDAEGRARLEGLPQGRLPLEVQVDGVGLASPRWVDVPSAGERLVRLSSTQGATVEGVVTDVEGAAVAGAQVLVASQAAPIGEEGTTTALLAVTDAAGAWRVSGLPPGRLVGIAARAPGFVPLEDIEARQRVVAGASLRVDLPLVAAATLLGEVRGPDDAPVAGAEVVIEERAARTDGEGRWRLGDLAPGLHEVRVRAPGLFLPGSPSGGVFEPRGGLWVLAAPGQTVRAPPARLSKGVRIEGRVVDERGGPLAGAWVSLTAETLRFDSFDSQVELRATSSGEDGGFAFDGLPEGNGWSLRARHERLSSGADASAALAAEGRPVRAEIVLRPLGRLAGVALDLAGRPVPGLELELHATDAGSSWWPRDVRTVADAEGRFAFEDLVAQAYRVTPTFGARRHQEKPSARRLLGPGEDARDLVLRLDPPRGLSGTVVDERGAPAAGVHVGLKADEPWVFTDRWLQEESWWQWDASTDDAGRFRFENLAPGGYWIRPDRADAASDLVNAGEPDVRLVWYRDRLPDADGPEVDRYNRWTFTGTRIPLEIHVLDPEGRDVAAGTVRMTLHAGAESGGTQSLTWRFRHGRARTTTASDAAKVSVEVLDAQDAAGRPLEVAVWSAQDLAPDVGRVEARLARGGPRHGPLSGRVAGPEGEALAGVVVRAAPAQLPASGDDRPGWSDRRSWIQTATDTQGAFRFEHLVEGAYDLEVDPGGPWAAASGKGSTGAVEVTLAVERARWLTGRVLDEEGRPLAGASVQAGEARATTSFDGAFRVGPIRGATDLVVQGPDAALRSRPGLTYAQGRVTGVEAGGPAVEIRLARIASVAGRVLDAAGKSVPDARIRLEPLEPSQGRAPIDGEQAWHDSGFHLRGVPPGRWRLTASDEEGKRHSAPLEIEAPAQDLEVRLDEQPQVAGRLRGADVGDFRVAIVGGPPDAPEVARVRTDARGAFAWSTREAGPFRLRIWRPGDDRCAVVEGVRPGTPVGDLTLGSGLSIEGRLTGLPAGLDPSCVALYALTPDGTVLAATVGADGAFVVRGLAAGETLTLRARAGEDGGELVVEASGVAAGTRALTLELRR